MLEFKFSKNKISFEENIQKIAELNSLKLSIKWHAMKEIFDIYDECKNIEKFVDEGQDICWMIIGKIIDKAVQCCIKDGYYEIDENAFLAKDVDGIITDPFNEKYGAIYKAYTEIIERNNNEHEYREMRKNSRGQFIGGGFGLTGAISGSLKAGALNIATGLVHSAYNAVGNAMSSYSASKQLESLYKNPACKQVLLEAAEKTVDNVWMIMISKVYGLSLATKEELKTVEAIINNIKNNRIPKDKQEDALMHVLSINPLENNVYEYLMPLLSSEDKEVLQKMKEVFCVDCKNIIHDIKCCIEKGISEFIIYSKIEAFTGGDKEKLAYARNCIMEGENLENGTEELKKLIDQNYIPAIKYFAQTVSKGELPYNNPEEVMVAAYERLVVLGETDSYSELANVYQKGTDVISKDESKALKYFEKSVEIGKGDYFEVISAYIEGKGTEKDYNKSFQYTLKALEQPDLIDFSRELYIIYEAKHYANGWGCEKNVEKAIELLKSMIFGDEDKKIDTSLEGLAMIELCNIAYHNGNVDVDWEKIYKRTYLEGTDVEGNALDEIDNGIMLYCRGLLLEYQLCSASKEVVDVFDIRKIYQISKYKKSPGRYWYVVGCAFEKYLPHYAKLAFEVALDEGEEDAKDKINMLENKENYFVQFENITENDIHYYEIAVNKIIINKEISPERCVWIIIAAQIAKLGYQIDIDWEKVYALLNEISDEDSCKESGMSYYCMGLILEYGLYVSSEGAYSCFQKAFNSLSEGCFKDTCIHASYCNGLQYMDEKKYLVAKSAFENAKDMAKSLQIEFKDLEIKLREVEHIIAIEGLNAEEHMQNISLSKEGEGKIDSNTNSVVKNEDSNISIQEGIKWLLGKIAWLITCIIFAVFALALWEKDGMFWTVLSGFCGLISLGAVANFFGFQEE